MYIALLFYVKVNRIFQKQLIAVGKEICACIQVRHSL